MSKSSGLKNRAWFYYHGPVLKVPCFWCKVELTFKQATVEHVIPRSEGGTNDVENLAIACGCCNQGRHRLLSLKHQILARYGEQNESRILLSS